MLSFPLFVMWAILESSSSKGNTLWNQCGDGITMSIYLQERSNPEYRSKHRRFRTRQQFSKRRKCATGEPTECSVIDTFCGLSRKKEKYPCQRQEHNGEIQVRDAYCRLNDPSSRGVPAKIKGRQYRLPRIIGRNEIVSTRKHLPRRDGR